MMPSSGLRDRVLAAAKSTPSPTRAQVRIRNAALLVSGALVPLGVFAFSDAVPEASRPTVLVVETVAAAAAVALTAGIVAFGRGRSMLGRPGVFLLSVAVLTPLALFFTKIALSAAYPGMMEEWPERPGFRCLRLSCLMVAWPLVALVLTRRGSDPTHPRLTGAAIGAAVGACAWVLVDLLCPVAYVPHLLLGHVLPLVATTAVGTWLGGRTVALKGR